jgi:hypothetical protein
MAWPVALAVDAWARSCRLLMFVELGILFGLLLLVYLALRGPLARHRALSRRQDPDDGSLTRARNGSENPPDD